jgi:hypothetical protein
MSDIDGLRRKMINAGIPSEYAATATGIAAEYAQAAYQCGYNRGYDWKSPFVGVRGVAERNLSVIGSTSRPSRSLRVLLLASYCDECTEELAKA